MRNRRLGYLSEVQVIDRRFRLQPCVFRFARRLVTDGNPVRVLHF